MPVGLRGSSTRSGDSSETAPEPSRKLRNGAIREASNLVRLPPFRRTSALGALWSALTLFACDPSGQGDVQGGPSESQRIAFPQAVYQGGPLLIAPKVVTVTFSGDALAGQLESFGQSVTASAWWDSVRRGYCAGSTGPCVGDGPSGSFVELPTAPAPTYSDSDRGGASTLQAWLANAITAGVLPGPDANPVSNTLYVIYFPETTTVSLDDMTSCVNGDFDGYHGSMAMGSQQIVYAVVVECPPLPTAFPGAPQPTVLQSATVAASHEIVEASTDPSGTQLAYYLDTTDPTNWGWMDIAGAGEVADLCVDPFALGQDETSSGSFTVQRIWSNANAASLLDPCNPIPEGEVYFNAAPRQSVFVLDVGASATFEVSAFSDGTMSDWTLSAADWSDSVTTSYLSFSIAGGTETDASTEIQVNDGSAVQVTVTLLADPGTLTTHEADGVIVSASAGSDGVPKAHWWPFIVMSSADAADAGIGPAYRMSRWGNRFRVHRRGRRGLPR
jgi:hypothetical protein